MNQYLLSFLLFGTGILTNAVPFPLPASPADDCNHDGFLPIDYCIEEHEHDGILTSKSLQCEQVGDKWYVQEITYLNSNDCTGDDISIGESKECLAEQGCVCGPESNDCRDPSHQKLFYLVNGIHNEASGICEYDEFDAFVLYSYDEEVGVDCSSTDDGYIERTDTCQRIYCNADGLIIKNKRRRRRLFIFTTLFMTGSTWTAWCAGNAARGYCSTMSNVMCSHCW